MPFDVKLSNQATKFLNKQDTHIRERLKTALKKLKDPFQVVERFEGENCYKFRVGDYRALVDIDMQHQIVWVRVLDKRGRVYKR